MTNTQTELPLFVAGQSVKPRQMEALRLPFSVMVDEEVGSLLELRGWQMLKTEPRRQWAVPNTAWLQKLKDALAYQRGMLKQHEAERGAVEELIRAILNRSRTLTEEDMPKPDQQAVRPAAPKVADYSYIDNGQANAGKPAPGIYDDEDPLPF